MGSKPSNNFQSDRPESGGADHDSARENSGLLENNKQKYAADHADVFAENRPRKPVVETPKAPDQSEPDGPTAPRQAALKPDSLGG